MQRYKKQAIDLGVYMFASLIPMIFSILTNPLIAMNMSPTDYATVGYYAAFNVLVAPLVNFFLLQYYTKRYFELSNDGRLELKAVLIKVLIYFSLISAAFCLGGIFLYIEFFNKDTLIPFLPYSLISVMSIPLTGIYSLNLVDYRMQRRSKSFFTLSVSSGIFAIALSLLLVVFLKYGALGKLLSVFICNLFVFVYCIYSNKQLFKIKFNKSIFYDALKFCYPLVLANMLSFFSTGFDKVLLERMDNIVELGFYIVGVQIAGYLGVFSTSIDDTFQPDIFESIIQRNFKKCAKIIAIKLCIVSFIVLLFIVLAPFVVDILTAGRYVDSTKYAVIVALSSITSMLYFSLSQVTIALGYTKLTLINKIAGGAICIWMFSTFIAKWGAIGASWGIVLSYIVFFIGNIFLIALKMKYRYDVSKNT